VGTSPHEGMFHRTMSVVGAVDWGQHSVSAA
jgi:hypothetical protein